MLIAEHGVPVQVATVEPSFMPFTVESKPKPAVYYGVVARLINEALHEHPTLVSNDDLKVAIIAKLAHLVGRIIVTFELVERPHSKYDCLYALVHYNTGGEQHMVVRTLRRPAWLTLTSTESS